MTTLKDIAKATGFSLSTVSAVIGGRAGKLAISRETSRKVLEAAKKLDYLPNLSARTLRDNRSRIIGILMPNLKMDFWQSLILDLQREIRKRDSYIALSALWDDCEGIQKCTDEFLARSVDGIVTADPGFLPEGLRIPVVAYDGEPSARFDTVAYDQEATFRLAVGRLASLGHKRIGLAGTSADDRNIRFHKVMLEFGLSGEENYSLMSSDKYKGTGYYEAEAAAVLGDDPGKAPTAVISLNNISTLCIMKRAALLGLAVPENLSIIAVDDSITYSLLTPEITTILRSDVPFSKLLIEILFARIAHPDTPIRSLRTKPSLVERASCSAPKICKTYNIRKGK